MSNMMLQGSRSIVQQHQPVRWVWRHLMQVETSMITAQPCQRRARTLRSCQSLNAPGIITSSLVARRHFSTSTQISTTDPAKPITDTTTTPIVNESSASSTIPIADHGNSSIVSTDTAPEAPSATTSPVSASSPPSSSLSTSTSTPSSTPHPGYLISDQSVFLADGTQATINELLKDKKVLLLGYVAAYTRLCQQSLSAYAHKAHELKKKHGIDHLYAIAVNDHAVLASFAQSLSLTHGGSNNSLSLIADYDARVTRWLGMEIDLTAVGFGLRSQRYVMLVDHQQIKLVRVEPNVGTLDVTSVDNIIKILNNMKKEKEAAEKQQQQSQQSSSSEKECIDKQPIVDAKPIPEKPGGVGIPTDTTKPLVPTEAEEAQRIPPLIQ